MTKLLGSVLILVVDDEPDIREILREELEFVGAKITEAGSGNEAFDLVSKQKFDFVITDANMPNGDGFDLLGKIREKDTKHPFVIFVSGQAEFSPAKALAEGANAIFGKPMNVEDLIARMRILQKAPIDRWSRKSERVKIDESVNLSFKDLPSSIEGRSLDIGQGGMFVALESKFPKIGSSLAFSIDFEDSKLLKKIEGVGVVRWVRHNQEGALPPGIGIEFLELEDLPNFLGYLNQLNTKAYIPE